MAPHPPSGPLSLARRLTTWAEVVAAVKAGLLDEDHQVELKQDVPATSKGANLELAKDLAALSVDGGLFVIGVTDEKSKAGEVVGTVVAGLADRIHQVAARIDPPLQVDTTLVPMPGNDERAVVVVSVPASADAPHMVDDRYWGRGPDNKRALPDPEVRRLLDARRQSADGFEDRLRATADLDGDDMGDHPRFYLLLEPTIAPSEAAIDRLRGRSAGQIARESLTFNPQHGPSLATLDHEISHPDGLVSASQAAENQFADYYMFLLLSRTGAVHLGGPAAHPPSKDDTVTGWVWVAHLLQSAHSALQLAAHVADRDTGYTGTWRVGVLATHIKGAKSSLVANSHFVRTGPYPQQQYERAITATTAQLRDHTAETVARLTRDLLRGLSIERTYLPYDSVDALWDIEQSRRF